jgi:hypothetical protein
MVRIIYILFILLFTSCIYGYKVTINNNNLNHHDSNYVIIHKDNMIYLNDTLTEWNYKKIE